MINEREIMLTGMSRSGNHAIINWIWRQGGGRRCLLNCAEGRTNPFQSCRPMDDGGHWRVNYDGFDIAAEAAGRFGRKDLLIHSYEDCFLSHAYSEEFERNHDRFVGPSRQRFDLLVLRDPFNLFASRLALDASPLTPRMGLRVWRQHAREALGERRHRRHNPLLVNYNRWVVDRDYRAGLAARLGLDFSDAGIDEVTACGGGSSFDGLRYHGRAREMPVLERWRRFAHDPDYWALFDRVTIDLATRIFGPIPALAWVASQPAARAL